MVHKFRPNIIIGYPSAAKILVELTCREKEPLHVGRVISCGEPLSSGLRKFLENTFQAEVINFYGASESLALGVEQRADVLLCRNEDVLWFEKPDGSNEYLHPLTMEGFCVEGLLDYQFCQTSKTSFEMLAEAEESAERVKVKKEICRQVKKLLAEKELDEIQFLCSVCGENHTGKQFDEERALYHLQNADVTDCVFAGLADGESVLKESADVKGHIISVKNPKSGRSHWCTDNRPDIGKGI